LSYIVFVPNFLVTELSAVANQIWTVTIWSWSFLAMPIGSIADVGQRAWSRLDVATV